MKLKRIQAIAIAAADAGTLQKQIDAFIAQVRMLADQGLTLAEMGQIFLAFIRLLVYGVEAEEEMSGDEKKQLVLDWVGYLFDLLAPLIPLPWFLAPLSRFVQGRLRGIVLSVADGVIEAIVAWMNEPEPPTPEPAL